MQIYLLKDLKGHGNAGEIVNLNDGYAKNFVIKNNIGKVVDNQTLAEMKAKKESDKFKYEQEIESIKKRIARLNATQIVISVKVGENGKLFGGITAADIAHKMAGEGIVIDKRAIQLHEAIKTTGSYKINVKFAHNLQGDISVIVEGDKNAK